MLSLIFRIDCSIYLLLDVFGYQNGRIQMLAPSLDGWQQTEVHGPVTCIQFFRHEDEEILCCITTALGFVECFYDIGRHSFRKRQRLSFTTSGSDSISCCHFFCPVSFHSLWLVIGTYSQQIHIFQLGTSD